MKESKTEINKRKIRNGERKQFEKTHGTPAQIMDKLSDDGTKKSRLWHQADFMHSISRSYINAFAAQSGVGKSMVAMQSFGRAVRQKDNLVLIDFETTA